MNKGVAEMRPLSRVGHGPKVDRACASALKKMPNHPGQIAKLVSGLNTEQKATASFRGFLLL
jgi:hypothetical protein